VLDVRGTLSDLINGNAAFSNGNGVADREGVRGDDYAMRLRAVRSRYHPLGTGALKHGKQRFCNRCIIYNDY
jgi:hypothetical protein